MQENKLLKIFIPKGGGETRMSHGKYKGVMIIPAQGISAGGRADGICRDVGENSAM